MAINPTVAGPHTKIIVETWYNSQGATSNKYIVIETIKNNGHSKV